MANSTALTQIRNTRSKLQIDRSPEYITINTALRGTRIIITSRVTPS